MKLDTTNIICRNCQAEMPEHSLYCPKCSQKNTDGRIPIFAFVKDLFEHLFNLDSRLLRTGLGLFIPGKLTQEFFNGKHKSFAMPSRLFFVSTLLFFAILSFLVSDKVKGEMIQGDMFDIEKNTKSTAEIIEGVEKVKNQFNGNIPPEVQIQLDSIVTQALQDTTKNSLIDITLFSGTTYNFEAIDFKNLTADSMIQKYKIENFSDKIFFKQGYKLRKDPKSLITTLIGNLTWVLLLLIPSMALIFKLLYIRRKKYYVEHLVFLFHIHAFALLVGSVTILVIYFLEINTEDKSPIWLIGGMFLYNIFALKRVYQQGWIKTFIKLFLIFISYMIVLMLSISIVLMASFLLF